MGKLRTGLSFILSALCIVCAAQVRAALISVDWQAAGDDLLTRDTVTGFEWLDLTVTTSQTYVFVESQLGAGGLYAGFRHATRTELTDFQVSAGIPNIGQTTAANLVPVQGLIALVGVTQVFLGSVLDSDGFYNGTEFSPAGAHDRFHLTAPFQVTLGISNFFGSNNLDDQQSNPSVGHWLVRGDAVAMPEPGTLLLASLAVALALVRRPRPARAITSSDRA